MEIRKIKEAVLKPAVEIYAIKETEPKTIAYINLNKDTETGE